MASAGYGHRGRCRGSIYKARRRGAASIVGGHQPGLPVRRPAPALLWARTSRGWATATHCERDSGPRALAGAPIADSGAAPVRVLSGRRQSPEHPVLAWLSLAPSIPARLFASRRSPGSRYSVPASESASPSLCCCQDLAVIRAGRRLAGNDRRPATRKGKQHAEARFAIAVPMPGPAWHGRLTSFLPRAAGDRHRTGVSGYLVGQPDPPGDGGSPAGGGVDLAGTTERGEPVTHVPQSRPGRRVGGSKPGPSSVTSNSGPCPVSARLIRTADPGACRAALCRASTQQK